MSIRIFAEGKPREEPGKWAHMARTAVVSCPDCGVVGNLSAHSITKDGVVSPSLVCPVACGYHESNVILKGWIDA